MASSTQTEPVTMTVDATGFAAIVQSLLPEGIIVNNTTTGARYLSQRVASVMTLVPWTTGGSSTTNTTYLGGTIVPPTLRALSFVFGDSTETVNEVTAIALTGTLPSTAAVGTRYEVYDKTGNANPNFTITPNGGKLITGPGGVGASSLTITTQGFWRSITKMSDGNWLMAGL